MNVEGRVCVCVYVGVHAHACACAGTGVGAGVGQCGGENAGVHLYSPLFSLKTGETVSH